MRHEVTGLPGRHG